MIKEVREKFVDWLVEHSAPSDISPVSEVKLFLMTVRGKLRDLLFDHREGFYAPLDGMAAGPPQFRWQDAEVSPQILEDFAAVLENFGYWAPRAPALNFAPVSPSQEG